MKKITAILLAVSMVLAVGCSQKEVNTENFDVMGFYDSISSMTSESLVSLDDTYITNYYGINTADLDGYVFAQSEDPKSAESIIIFKCSDDAKRAEYVKAVETAIAQKADELKNYNQPEQAKLAEDCRIVQTGTLVYAVISPNGDAINSALDEELK